MEVIFMRGFAILAVRRCGWNWLHGYRSPEQQAQVAVDVGVAPDCPYGYYDVAPYTCAPAGYYGPEWFNAGVFIGAGPWFHGPSDFKGYVDNRFHPDHGFKGAMPRVGEKAGSRRSASMPRTSKATKCAMAAAYVAQNESSPLARR